MRKALLASFVLCFSLMLAACGGTPSNLDKANGDWACDVKATLALHPDLQQQAAGAPEMIEAMFSNFTLSIDSKNKKMTVSMGQVSESGDFTVISDSDNKLVLQMEDDKITLEFASADSVTMYSEREPEMKMVFKRK